MNGQQSSETIGAWQARKRAQAKRLIAAMPLLKGEAFTLHSWEDHHTRFVLVNQRAKLAIVIGQLARDDSGQPHIDLDDDAFLPAVIAAKGKAA